MHAFAYIFFRLPIKSFSFLLNYGGQYAHYYYAIKNIDHHARLKENEHLFRYQAWLEGNFFRCVHARANDAKIVPSRDAQCNTEESPELTKS